MDRGQSLIIPPLFDGINYAYWKVCMRAFLQSLDKKVWQAMEIGWTKPKEASADWDDAKIKAANFNSKALNALFSAVTNEEFKKISSTETTKEAWTILQTTYEGTKAIKDSKLQRLCEVEFIQPSNWLYSVPNLLVIQHLVTLYLGGFDVRVVSEIE